MSHSRTKPKNGATGDFSHGAIRHSHDYNEVMLIVPPPTCTIRWVLLGALFALAGCAGGEDVTTRSISEARQRWDRAGIRNYDLEWTSTGLSRAHYVVAVRDGEVRSITSILADGRSMAVHPAEPKFYGVEGLFMIIGDELAQLQTRAPFGQPKGTKAVLRFTPDPELGYPRRYRRDVLGTPLALAIDVVRFDAVPVRISKPEAETEVEPPPVVKPGSS